ncbi:MAG: hypothetical protein ACFFED_17690 [Candidatus Thorarchaeota archaeon]
MSERRKYPRQGEYGTPEVRCGWCGKNLPGEAPLTGGNYCSFDCSSAGRYEQLFCIVVMLSAGEIFMIAFAIYSAIAFSHIPVPSWPMPVIVAVFIIPALVYYLVSFNHGRNIRKTTEETYPHVEVIESEDDLTPLHHNILDFVREIPSNEEVTRSQIIESMQEKGSLSNSTKVAIFELVGAGFLEELMIGRYFIGKRIRRSDSV